MDEKGGLKKVRGKKLCSKFISTLTARGKRSFKIDLKASFASSSKAAYVERKRPFKIDLKTPFASSSGPLMSNAKRSFKIDLKAPFASSSLKPRSRTPPHECPKHDPQTCQKVS